MCVCVCVCVCVCGCVCICLSVIIGLCSGLFLCTVMQYIGFVGVLLNWMFQHDCLDTYCF